MGNQAIPGLDQLGRGFNPFDPNAALFGTAPALTAFRGNLIIFRGAGGLDFMATTLSYQTDSGGIWTVPEGSQSNNDPLGGTDYQVPADVAVADIFTTMESDDIFSSYQKISEYYSVQVGVAGGEGAFAGGLVQLLVE